MVLTDRQRKFLEDNFERARGSFADAKKATLHALLIVTTGTFVLSVSFVTAFSEKPFYSGWALMLSWICMALSIGTYIAFLHHDAEAEGAVIDELAGKMINHDLVDGYRPGADGKPAMFYERANAYMGLTYMLAALGVGLLLFFGLVNFATHQALQDEDFINSYKGYLNTKYQLGHE